MTIKTGEEKFTRDLIIGLRAKVTELEEANTKMLKELQAEKKIVNHYAENGYSFAVKRVKERQQ